MEKGGSGNLGARSRANSGNRGNKTMSIRTQKKVANTDIPTYEEIRAIFKSIDKDGDGLINFKELKDTR